MRLAFELESCCAAGTDKIDDSRVGIRHAKPFRVAGGAVEVVAPPRFGDYPAALARALVSGGQISWHLQLHARRSCEPLLSLPPPWLLTLVRLDLVPTGWATVIAHATPHHDPLRTVVRAFVIVNELDFLQIHRALNPLSRFTHNRWWRHRTRKPAKRQFDDGRWVPKGRSPRIQKKF